MPRLRFERMSSRATPPCLERGEAATPHLWGAGEARVKMKRMGDSPIDRLVSRSRQSGPRGFPHFCGHEAAMCSPAFSWNRRMKWFARRCQSAMQTSFMLMAVGLTLNYTGCALFPAMKSTLTGDATNGSSGQNGCCGSRIPASCQGIRKRCRCAE